MNWLGIASGSTFVLAFVGRCIIGSCDLVVDAVHDRVIDGCYFGSRTCILRVWQLSWVLR